MAHGGDLMMGGGGGGRLRRLRSAAGLSVSVAPFIFWLRLKLDEGASNFGGALICRFGGLSCFLVSIQSINNLGVFNGRVLHFLKVYGLA